MIALGSFWAIGSQRYNYEAIITIIGSTISILQYAKNKWGINDNGDENIGVTHYATGVDSWKLGITGYFLKKRGIISMSLFVAILILGLATWQKNNQYYFIPIHQDLITTYLVYSILLSTFLIYLALAFYVKRRSIRSLKMKESLHHLLHKSRDEVCELIYRTNSFGKKKNSSNIEYERKIIESYSCSVCDNIKEYFTILTGDQTVTCAIRLAYIDPIKLEKKLAYATVGRCSNLNKNRKETSEPIPSDKGIPNFFSSEKINFQGVLFYDDLELASKKNAYLKTNNDIKYPDDIKSIIVAPLNGWNGEKKALIGLLYINSKTKKILQPIHTDLIAFTADTLSLSYSSIFSHLLYAKNMPEFG